MYQTSYAETLEDTPAGARSRERDAILRTIAMLQDAKTAGAGSPEAAEALATLTRVWSFLLEDLANTSNTLPDALKAGLISIGIWMLGEAEQIRLGNSVNFDGLIDVSQTIADGLK